MEIKSSQFFRYYFLKLPELCALKEVSTKEKLGLVVGAVALSIFSFGIVPLICKALYDRSFKVLNRSSSNSLLTSKTTQVVLTVRDKQQKFGLEALSLEELSEFGKEMSVEDFLTFDFGRLGKNREKFQALFSAPGLGQPLPEKLNEVIRQLDPQILASHIELFQGYLRVEDYARIEAVSTDDQLLNMIGTIDYYEREKNIPPLKKEEFQILLKIEGDEPRSKRLIPRFGDFQIPKYAPLLSEKHWPYLRTTQEDWLFTAIAKGQFYEDEWPPMIEHFLNRRPEQAKRLLVDMMRQGATQVGSMGYYADIPTPARKETAQFAADLFPFLSEELKQFLISDEGAWKKGWGEKPILLEKLQEEVSDKLTNRDMDFLALPRWVIEHANVPTSQKEALFQWLFNASNRVERETAFQAIDLDKMFSHLSLDHISWITEKQALS